MELFIDDSNVEEIRKLTSLYPIDGVTTNPTILSRSKLGALNTLKEIREIIGEDRPLFAQVIGETREEMLEDAHALLSHMNGKFVIKIPVTPAGVQVIRELSESGVLTCGTVVMSPMQAFLAAKAGACYVAPYLNRIDNMGYDGVRIVKEIQDILDNNGLDSRVLAASFRNSQQVTELAAYGVDSMTLSVTVFEQLIPNMLVEGMVKTFSDDFYKSTGCRSWKELLDQ